MTEALYIFLGWLLGLFSPIIADRIRVKYERRKFKRAVAGELADLKYRLAVVSFLLHQRLGMVDVEYLTWVKSKISDYQGSEPDEAISAFVEKLLTLDEATLASALIPMKADEGIGLSLKTYSPSYFESNFDRIADLPDALQIACHEFRNHLSVMNQEIQRVMESHSRTFDSSMSDTNHERLVQDIQNRHLVVSNMCRTVVEKIDLLQAEL